VTQQVELRAREAGALQTRGAARALVGRASSIAMATAGLWLAAQAPAQAQTDFSATASYLFGGGVRSQGLTQVISGGETVGAGATPTPGGASLFVEKSGDFGVGLASVTDSVKMSVAFGHMGIKISGGADATGADSNINNFVDARTTMSDTLTVTGLAPGKRVQLHEKLFLDGTNEVLADVEPNAILSDHAVSSLQVTIDGTGVDKLFNGALLVNHSANVGAGAQPPIDKRAPPFIDQVVDLFMGISTRVTVGLHVNGNIGLNNRTNGTTAAEFTGDYFHTLGYLPGAFFTDADTGEVLDNVHLVSASGFDYLNPPPEGSDPSGVAEPAAWSMMIGGFGMAGGLLRRKRRRPAIA